MMPEQNEEVRGRDEEPAAESEYPRTGPTPAERAGQAQERPERMRPEQAGTQVGTEPAAAERAGSEQDRSEPTPSGQMPSEMPSGQRSEQRSGSPEDERRERLVPEDHAAAYGSRWDAVKGTFVDEPRKAVAQADALVGELLEELETLFREQRRSIEQGLDADETSTEDLRLALRRYRSFFERLLAV
jgi:hypothetical protein